MNLKSIGELSNKKIIELIYGRHYIETKIGFAVVYMLIASLFFLSTVPLIAEGIYEEKPTPTALSETQPQEQAYITTTITNISLVKQFEDSPIYCIALTENRECFIVSLLQKKYDEVFANTPGIFDTNAKPGIDVYGVMSELNSTQKQFYIDSGLFSDLSELEDYCGSYSLELFKEPATKLDDALFFGTIFGLFPAFLTFCGQMVSFRKYRTLKKDLKRLRKSKSVYLVEEILHLAPFRAKNHDILFTPHLFFSSYDGCLVKYSEIVWAKTRPGIQIGSADFLHFHFADNTRSMMMTALPFKQIQNSKAIVNKLQQINPKIMSGTNLVIQRAYRDIVKGRATQDTPFDKGEIQAPTSLLKREINIKPIWLLLLIPALIAFYFSSGMEISANEVVDILFTAVIVLLALCIAIYTKLKNIRNKHKLLRSYSDITRTAFSSDKKLRKKLDKAVLCFHHEKSSDALSILNELKVECKTTDDYSAVHILLAENYAFQGDDLYDFAIAEYKKALHYDKDCGRAWFEMSVLLARKGRFQEARQSLLKAIDTSYDRNLTKKALISLDRVTNEE